MTGLQVLGITRQIGNLYAALSAPICRKFGVNQTELDVILFCANNPGQNTARDLCRLRGIKTAMASVAVEHLIQQGLLTRQPDAADRRVRRLVPTGKAAEMIAAGQEMQQQFAARLRRDISPEEQAAMESVFEKLQKTLRQTEISQEKDEIKC